MSNNFNVTEYINTFQALRIPTNWRVTHNAFTNDVDQLTDNDLELQGVSGYDVVHFYSEWRNLFISVDWKYKNGKGFYCMEVFEVLEVFNPKTNTQDLKFADEPRETHTIETTQALVEKLEYILRYADSYEDPRILKNRGEIDEPSESYRLELVANGLTEELITKILENGNKQIQHITLDQKDINREIILRFLNESKFPKMKKRAEMLLKNKKFR